MIPDPDDWWSKERVCDHTGLSPRTFDRYVKDGLFAVRLNGAVYVQCGPFFAEYRRRLIARRDSRFRSRSVDDVDSS